MTLLSVSAAPRLALGAINPVAGIAAAGLGILYALQAGRAAKESKDATQRVEELATALADPEFTPTQDIARGIRERLEATLNPEQIQELMRKGFDLGAISRDVEAGTLDVMDVIERIAGDGFHRVEGNAISALDSAMDTVGAGNAEEIFNILIDASEEYGDSVTENVNRSAWDEVIAGLVETETKTRSLAQETDDFNNILARLSSRDRNIAFAPSDELASDIRNRREDLERVKGAAEEARQAVIDFLSGDYANTLQETIDEFVLGLKPLGAQFAEAFAEPVEQTRAAMLRQLGAGVETDLAARFRLELIADPTVDKEKILADALAEVEAAFQAGEITAEAKAAITWALTKEAGETDWNTLLADLIKAGEIPTQTIDVPFKPNFIPESPGADNRGRGGHTGIPMMAFADSGAGATTTIDMPVTVNPVVTLAEGSGATVGLQVAAAIASGIMGAGVVISLGVIAAVRLGDVRGRRSGRSHGARRSARRDRGHDWLQGLPVLPGRASI